jgi:hypothetical protein
MQPQWIDGLRREAFAQQLDGHCATAADIATVENAAGSPHFFQRHVATRAGERDVVRHSATHVNVIASEVEAATQPRRLSGRCQAFNPVAEFR